MSYLLSNKATFNALTAGYTGIIFEVNDSDGSQIRAQVMSQAVTSNDYFGSYYTAPHTGQWYPVTILFSQMSQAGWGHDVLPTAYNPATEITGVKFDITSTGNYAFLLDQVAFFGPLPTATPTGTWYTATPTVTATPTITPTPTVSPTFTPTGSATPTKTSTPPPDTTLYNFENGTVMGWSNVIPSTDTTQNSSTMSFLGNHSLAVSLNFPWTATGDNEFGVEPQANLLSPVTNLTGKTLIAHLWVPSNFPVSLQADIYFKSGGSWAWQTGPSTTLVPNTWNTLTLDPTVSFNVSGTPDITNVLGIGIQILYSGTWTGTVYMDSMDVLYVGGSPTPTPTVSPTITPSPTLTPTPSLTSTPTLTLSPTPSPTNSPTPTNTPTPSPTPTLTQTPTPTTACVAPLLYPNPVRGDTMQIRLSPCSITPHVSVKLFTVSFRKVMDLDVNPIPSAGNFSLPLLDNWNKPLTNGLYYLVITTPQGRTITKMLVIR